jgi:hypothetical protein
VVQMKMPNLMGNHHELIFMFQILLDAYQPKGAVQRTHRTRGELVGFDFKAIGFERGLDNLLGAAITIRGRQRLRVAGTRLPPDIDPSVHGLIPF